MKTMQRLKYWLKHLSRLLWRLTRDSEKQSGKKTNPGVKFVISIDTALIKQIFPLAGLCSCSPLLEQTHLLQMTLYSTHLQQ